MDEFVNLETIQQASAFVRQHIQATPRLGLILGSGLNTLADAVAAEAVIPYSDIPHFPHSSVVGHAGQWIIGKLEGQPIIVMQGRAHYYEGHSMARVTLPVRVMRALGVELLIVTNAAGGLNPSFEAGDVMLIRDHINLVGMTGIHPLRGPNLDELGPRFVDMTHAYDAQLRTIAHQVATAASIPCHDGVYVYLAGPSFETPAEIRLLRILGGDAVGMSTAPEVTIARHGGMRVLGISGISNVAQVIKSGNADGSAETTHEEVLQAGRLLVPRLETIVRGVLKQL